MDRKELEAKVCELVAISYKQDPSAVTVETSFKDDLKGASVQMVALVAEIENENGTHDKVKYVVLTDLGRAFDPDSQEDAE